MKNVLLLLFFSLLAATAQSQAVSWELSAQPGNQAFNDASFESANFDNGFLTRGAGISAINATGSMNSSDWFEDATPTTLAQAIDNDDYYEFRIETINCLFFNPTTIKIVLRSSATGPNTATLRCSSDGFTANIGTVTVTTTSTAFSFSEAISPNSQSVTYRLYGYGSAAGGGNPSSGGTMRVGTSVVASDNDLEIFASSTSVQVAQVGDITVNHGASVPATTFTANVPGATVSWSRTPEAIGLGATSGTGNLPAFTATNNSGSPITSTVTVHASIGSCVGPDMVFTITVNPPVCDILAVNFLGNPGPCNDNGTPNNPNDDFFTQNIQASFINRPLTGNLQIVPGGDQIGIYTIPVSQIVGNSHIFNAVQLKADGTPSVITVNFTDNPACAETQTGTTVQSCSSGGAVCEIIGFSFANIGSCNDKGTPSDSADDFFTVNVDVIYSNSVAGRTLRLGGADVVNIVSANASTGTNLTLTLPNVKLRASGQITNFIGELGTTAGGFTPNCSLPGTGPAVNSCSSGGSVCSISSINLSNVGSCNDNGTSDPSDDFFAANVLVTFANPSSTGSLEIEPGGDAIGTNAVPVANLVGNSHTFTNVHFKADGTTTVIEVDFTSDNSCVRTATASAVSPCSFTPPVLTCPGAVVVSCANLAPAVNPASVTETHSCSGNVTITHLNDVNSNVFCINRLTITRTYQGTDQCGQTATCSQIITLNDQTPPTVTCPGPLTLSCASQVPPSDLSSLVVTDNCAGTLGISRSFLGEVSTNLTCANRFTLTRTYRGGDACGNTATCTQVITVNDQTPPSLTCPAPVTFSCFENVPPITPTSVTNLIDNCGGAAPTASVVGEFSSANGVCPNDFTITRVFRATDLCGNSATCSQLITIKDQIPPTVVCPTGLTVSCAEQVPAPNPALVTASDNCLGPVPTKIFLADVVLNQTCTNRKTINRTYRATDACGNSATCSQTITVNDQTPPVFTAVPANITVDCYLVPGVGIATASDNCTSGATVTFLGETSVPGICPVWKILTRTWRATDACGNSATASQVITVTDFNAPQFIVLPKNKVVECGSNNQAEFQAFLDNIGAAVVQDCAQITYTHEDSPVQNNYFDCGYTFHKNIRFFATDECGNVSYRDASFTVVDQTPPVFSTPPQNLDVACDASEDNGENAFYDWLDSNAGLVVKDNCGEVELAKIQISEYAGCGNTWRKTYEFRAKDECGNFSKTTATFSVVDHTPPTLICPPNDNVFLSCVEDVPAADPTAISAQDCSGVTTTLTDTWTNGTGCPGWPMTVAYRYTATDGCGNQSVCERAYYVKETNNPTIVCPDTIKLTCVDDIPGPVQLFGYIKNQLTGNCAGGFSSISILSDSGQPQNGATHRTYTFTAKNHCGMVSSACSVTFKAIGTCNQLCTASQGSWGDPNGTVGGMSTADALQILLAQHGSVTAGGGNHLVSAADVDCVQELLFGSGNIGFLPTGDYTCPLPASLSNPDGSLNNQLAANAIALQLNIWYNLHFNNRDLGGQDLHHLPPCLVEFALLKDLAQHSTVQDLLDASNQYLQGFVGNHPADFPALLNAGLDNVNHFRADCGLNAPCERPGHGRSTALSDSNIWSIGLAPNPATDAVTLTFETQIETVVTIQISDGRAVRSRFNTTTVKGLNTLEISLKDFSAGVYYLSLQSKDWVNTMRLVKLRN